MPDPALSDPSIDNGRLSGFVIGVTADRRGEEQSLMFRRLGAEVVHGPAIATLPTADLDRLRLLTDELIDDPPDYFVANTGMGVRQWLALASSWGREGPLLDALSSVKIASRGPKATGALRSAGLPVWWRAPDEQLVTVAARLLEDGVAGRRVAFQLHGDDRQALTAALVAGGAKVTELPVYRWTLPADASPVLELITRCCEGSIDAVTFTAGPAVRNLLQLAAATDQDVALRHAFDTGVLPVCIGPVCAGVAIECGITRSVVPDNWRLGAMVRLVAETLAPQRGG